MAGITARGIRWPTLLFGALPATWLALPAAVGILFGAVFTLTGKAMAFVILGAGILGWVGAVALWAAARSPGPVTPRTAWGLAGGLAGALLFVGVKLFDGDLAHRLGYWPAWLTMGPMAVAAWHLWQLRGAARLPSAAAAGPGRAAAWAHGVGPRRIRPETLDLVLRALLFGVLEVGLFVAPWVLRDREGWASLTVSVATFPFGLAVALLCVWTLWVYRELRGLAGGVLAVLLAWPWTISLAHDALGPELATRCAVAGLALLPGAVVLLLPRQAALFVPGVLLRRGTFQRLCALQAAMLVPWPVVLLWVRPWERKLQPVELWAMIGHAGGAGVLGAACLALAWVALFAGATREHPRPLLASLVLSLVLLALSATTLYVFGLFFAAATVG